MALLGCSKPIKSLQRSQLLSKIIDEGLGLATVLRVLTCSIGSTMRLLLQSTL